MQRNDVIAAWLLGFVCLFFLPPLALLFLAVAAFHTLKLIGSSPLTSHGTARFCSWVDAQRAGLLADDGLVLGRADRLLNRKERRALAKLLRLRAFTHLATFAPAGKGKGVSVVIPNLLMYGGSVVVTDPKGENYRLTAAYRQYRFRQRILRLDVTQPGGDCLNPLDFIDPWADDFLEQCRELAVMLVNRQEDEKEPHWNDMAELIICSIIAFVCACEQERSERNLITVRHILLSRERFCRTIIYMQNVTTFGGIIAELGHQLTWPVERELSSIMSTVQRHTAFLDSPAVARSVMRTSFDPRILRTPQGASIYLCFPHDRLKALAPLNRMWTGTLLRLLTRGTPTEKHPVLFILDEVAHLGRLPALEEAVTLHRGMGIRLWFIWQARSQARKCFGDEAETILANIDTKQYFGITDYETADALSKEIGETTILVKSENRTKGRSRPDRVHFQTPQPGSTSDSLSITYNEQGRHLVKPDEVIRLDEDVTLITHRNLPVIASTLVKYYADAEFADYRQLAAGQLPSPTHRLDGPKKPRLPVPLTDFGRRFIKAAAALTLLGVVLMVADPKSDLSQAIERGTFGGNPSSVATPGVATPARRPATPPMRPVLVPVDKYNYLLIPGEQFERYRAEHPDVQPAPAPLKPRKALPPKQPARQPPLPRWPLPRRPSPPSVPIPLKQDSRDISRVAGVSLPAFAVDSLFSCMASQSL